MDNRNYGSRRLLPIKNAPSNHTGLTFVADKRHHLPEFAADLGDLCLARSAPTGLERGLAYLILQEKVSSELALLNVP